MSYHHSSSYPLKRRSYLTPAKWLILLTLLLLSLGSGYYYRDEVVNVLTPVMGQVAKAKEWVASLKKKRAAKSVIAANSSEKERPVHFEFYSTLPAMAVNLPKKAIGQDKKELRVANNQAQPLSPFASSRDQLVKELATKLDESELQSPLETE